MKVELFYPDWRKKALTFTIDDGNIALDRKFLQYVNPAGFRGTFNLVTPLNPNLTPDDYRAMYAGHDIADHCRHHAYPFRSDRTYEFTDEPFDPDTADRTKVYRTGEEGLYRIYTYAWTYLADDDTYMECVASCRKELESVFGQGSIRGYVWPCGEQPNAEVMRRLTESGFTNIRKTGCTEDKTAFAIPQDRMHWSYNANHTNLLTLGDCFDRYEDDGELKLFCFGVHSHDFENNHCWDVLETFCQRFGNREETFWYAPIADVFDYEDALRALVIDGDGIHNPTDKRIYLTVDGTKVLLLPGQTY